MGIDDIVATCPRCNTATDERRQYAEVTSMGEHIRTDVHCPEHGWQQLIDQRPMRHDGIVISDASEK